MHSRSHAEYPFERPSDAGDPQRFQKVRVTLPWPRRALPALHGCIKTWHRVRAETWSDGSQR